ncbi:MAG: XRE family transcriptional regulator [Firmicutes bacterium]|nr:XRE family transcriptional regulator [Bacillota bacterium]
MEGLNQKIGQRLRRLRTARGYSLERLAELTGVSKPMLGQVERGESNPTVGTLWKIAGGLGVSFSAFIEEPSPRVFVVRATETMTLTEDAGRFVVSAVFTARPERPLEIFWVLLKPGCRRESEAHGEGVEEFITVSRGRLLLKTGDAEYYLAEGDSVCFTAGCKHVYINPEEQDCQVYMVITYPVR